MVKRVCLAVKGAESAVVRYVPESRGARFALYPTDSAARDAEVQSADWPVTLTLGGEGSLSAWFIHGFQLHLVDGVPQLWLAEPLAAAAAGIVVVNPVVVGGRVVGGKYSRQQARRVLPRATYRDAAAYAARSLLLNEAEVAARIKGVLIPPHPARRGLQNRRARAMGGAYAALRQDKGGHAPRGRGRPARAGGSARAGSTENDSEDDSEGSSEEGSSEEDSEEGSEENREELWAPILRLVASMPTQMPRTRPLPPCCANHTDGPS